MKTQQLRLTLALAILLMLLAGRVRGEPVGQVTINDMTYEIVPKTDLKAPAATFDLAGETYVLIPRNPPVVVRPSTAPSTLPATSPTTKPATQPASPRRPDATNTGVPGGTILKPAAGAKIKPGGVYDGLSFTGTQTVRLAKGETATFRNCRIDGDGGPYGVRCDGNLGAIVIDRCEILNVASAAVYGDHFDITNSIIRRSGGDGLKPGTAALIQGNYLTELGWNSPGAHADGVQIRGGSDIRIIGNYFDLPRGVPNTKSNAALFLQLEASRVVFADNYCRGGNFTIHAYADGNGGPTIQIVRNTFYAGSSQYGFGSIGPGVVWADNVTDAGKVALKSDK